MKHVILTIVLLLASGLVIAQTKMSDQLSKTTKMNAQSKIYFAGGCFWGTEHFMKQINGVTSTKWVKPTVKQASKIQPTNTYVTTIPDLPRQ